MLGEFKNYLRKKWMLNWDAGVVQQSSQKWNLKKHWLLSLTQPKTNWLFPQLKTDIKKLTNCLEQCNWILIYILLLFIVYPSFKEQTLSPKHFWGQKSPLLLAKSFIGHRRDKEKTPKRHRKVTEKTQKRHRKE